MNLRTTTESSYLLSSSSLKRCVLTLATTQPWLWYLYRDDHDRVWISSVSYSESIVYHCISLNICECHIMPHWSPTELLNISTYTNLIRLIGSIKGKVFHPSPFHTKNLLISDFKESTSAFSKICLSVSVPWFSQLPMRFDTSYLLELQILKLNFFFLSLLVS